MLFLRNVIKFEIEPGVDLSYGERETVRDSGEFEITEFDIAGFNCTLLHRALHCMTGVFQAVSFLICLFLILLLSLFKL